MSFVLFKDSYERYKVASFADSDLFTNLASRYTTVSGGNLGSVIASGRSGQALRLQFGSAVAKTLPHSGRWVLGFAFRLVVPSVGSDPIYQLSNNTNVLFTLVHNLDGTLAMHAGISTDPVIGLSARALLPARWYYLEIDITIGGASPLTVEAELRINGHIEASGTQNTVINATDNLSFGSTGGVDANYHLFAGTSGAGGSGGCDVDDLYIKNEAGYEGDIRVLAAFPSGDGGTLQWTPDSGSTHFDRVNTHPVDVTKFLATATIGDIDLWTFTLPSLPGTIVGVNISVLARKDDEGTKSFKIVVGASGTDASSDEFFVSDVTPEYYEFSLKVDPSTGSAFVPGSTLTVGVKLIS